MRPVADVNSINLEGLWYLTGALLFLHAAYHALVVSRKDVLLKLLADDYIRRSVASESTRIAEQIAVADRHQHHCFTPTTPQSPGG